MNKLKLAHQEIKSRLTGFSISIFGISWQPDETEIKIAKSGADIIQLTK
jgi:hypothetical protein